MLPRSSHHRRGHSSTYRSGSSSSEDYEVVSIEADSPALMDITTSPNDAGFSPYNVVERSTSLAPASPVQTTETETQFIEHHPPVAALDSPTHPAAPVRRPRGRPRKHPIEKPKREAKEGRANNGRSKTGCQTCRKRKKKCDETKPTCLNCTKNNLTCGGYPPATHWQPGRQNESKSNVLPPLLPYLSDDLDNFLFDHFHQVLDNMQEVPIAANTHSIRDHIFPLAPNDPGLMSAILAMSGYKWLQACPTPEENRYSLGEVEVRACQHFEKTLQRLRAPRPDGVWSEAEMASSIMLCLIATIDSHVARIYAFALVQLPRMLGNPRNSFSANLRRFANNFFTSHYSSFSITCTSKSRQELFPEEFSLPELIGTPEAGVYFGVLDELFLFLHKVKVLRDDVRARRSVNPSMMLDYPMVIRARALEKELQEWRCHQPNGSYQNASMLWRDCIWIYLKRTISTVPQLRELEGSVDNALAKLIAMRNEPSEQGTLIMPLFLLGCTALTNKQRSAVTVSFQVLIDQRRTDNLKTARDVVKYMWQLLDAGSDDAWDWEVLIEQLGKQGVSLS